jgi:hypothetical protein
MELIKIRMELHILVICMDRITLRGVAWGNLGVKTSAQPLLLRYAGILLHVKWMAPAVRLRNDDNEDCEGSEKE